ncbi:hypothetical protein CHUAL_010589 [Chamberlinius hualienensis]
MFELRILVPLLTFICLVNQSDQLRFTDISNNCTIPSIPYGLHSITGKSYLHWWTGDSTIKCANFVIRALPKKNSSCEQYNLTFSYYTANNHFKTHTWLTIENPTRKSEIECFDYDKDGQFKLVGISDMLYYEPNNGFIVLKCPATPGDVPMTMAIILFTLEKIEAVTHRFKAKLIHQGLDVTKLKRVYQGPKCQNLMVNPAKPLTEICPAF